MMGAARAEFTITDYFDFSAVGWLWANFVGALGDRL
jgi:hypothetical protein